MKFLNLYYKRISKLLFTVAYKVEKDFKIYLGPDAPQVSYKTNLLSYKNGLLEIDAGFTWNGPSGPAVDTKSFYIPSLVHDVLYEMIIEGALEKEYRLYADLVMYELCLLNHMPKIRAKWCRLAVNWFGWMAIKKTRVFLIEGNTKSLH